MASPAIRSSRNSRITAAWARAWLAVVVGALFCGSAAAQFRQIPDTALRGEDADEAAATAAKQEAEAKLAGAKSEMDLAKAQAEVAARAKLTQLTQEHRDLDAAIEAIVRAGNPDLMALARLKKRKLQLKDEITEINNGLLPDIIA